MTSTTIGETRRREKTQTEDPLKPVERYLSELGQNTPALITIGVVLLVIGLIVAFFSVRSDAKASQAKNALFLAQKTLDDEVRAATPAPTPVKDKKAPPAPPPSITYDKLDVDAKFPEAVKKLKAVEKDYGGTRAAYEARMILGNLYYHHQDSATATTWFQKAAESAPRSFDKGLSLESWGYSLESAGKYQDALGIFERVVKMGDEATRGDALLAEARIQEELHDVAKARATYDQVISKMAGTEYARKAEQAKARLE